MIANVLLVLGFLTLQRYFLIQPLPSLLRVQSVPESLAPKRASLKYEPNDALKSATKWYQGKVFGAGMSLI